jgi:capsular polysaccharide biosynthesis protein
MEINIQTVLNIVQRGKKYFLIVFIATLLVSTIIAFLLPVIYAAASIVLPLSPKSYDPRTKFSYMELYGSVEDINRTVGLAESGIIRDYIIKKYNLAARYEYTDNKTTDDYYIRQEYNGNLDVTETNNGSVAISFYDKDADTAALIVNDIVAQIDRINKSIIIDAVQKQFKTYQKVMQDKYNGLDSLAELMNAMKAQMKSPGGEVASMEMFHAYTRVKEAEVNLEAIQDDVQTLQVIEKAVPNWKKEKPKRLFLIVSACLSTFIITLLFLLVKDRKEFEEVS